MVQDAIETDAVLDTKCKPKGPWLNLGLINMDCSDSYRAPIDLNAINVEGTID